MTPIVQLDTSVLQALSDLKKGLVEIYGDRLDKVVLFGSHARGESVPASDVDVLVALKGPVSPFDEIRRTGALVSKVSLDHEHVVLCVFQPSDEMHSSTNPLIRNVRREGIPI